MALIHLFLLHSFIYIVSFSLTSAILPVESSVPDMTLICSPTDSTDCYPLTFEPTVHFKKIKEGQNIPPGLHVRLNIYTGEKEARLNLPLTGETNILDESEIVPKENAIIEIEQPLEEEESDQKFSQDESSVMQPLPEGRILSPESNEEIQIFQRAVNTLKLTSPLFDQALDELSELSHDIYFGREIIHDDSILEILTCLILGIEPIGLPVTEKNRERKAASILISALQNNAAALQEGCRNKNSIMYPSCIAREANQFNEKSNFVGEFWSKLKQEKDVSALKTKVSAISVFLKNPDIRDIFIENNGMELLLAIFLKEGKSYNEVRKKVGELLMDNFLDESSGAKINIWPRTRRNSNAACQVEERTLEDGCWEYHIELFATQVPAEKWPKELLLTLKDKRSVDFQKSEL